MNTTEKASSQPVSLWGIRSSIWSVVLVVLGGALGMAFDRSLSGSHTVFGVAIGTLAGSTVLAIVERKQGRGSRVAIVMGVVTIVWIVGLRIIDGG